MALLPETTSGVTDALLGSVGLLDRLSDTERQTGLRSCWIATVSGQRVGHAISYDDKWATAGSASSNGNCDELRSVFSSLRVPGSWYLSSIGVDPGWRTRGIGRQLMTHTAGRAHAAGVDLVSLHVFAEKLVALRLYASCGFREVGRSAVPRHPLLTARSDLLLMVARTNSILSSVRSS